MMDNSTKNQQGTAWHRYSRNRNLPPLPINELVDKIKSISYRTDYGFGLADAAALSVIYLWACRKREVLPYVYKGSYKNEFQTTITKPALQLKDIYVERDSLPDMEGDYKINIHMRIRNEKVASSRLGPDKITPEARMKLLEKTIYKEPFGIPENENDFEYPLLEIIFNWFEVNGWLREDLAERVKQLKPGESVWPFKKGLWETEVFKESYNRLNRVCGRLGFAVHNLRDWRLRHCRQQGMDIQTLAILGGWSQGSTMPLVYSKSSIHEVQRFFRDRKT